MVKAHKKNWQKTTSRTAMLDIQRTQFESKIKRPLDKVSKHAFLYLYLPDYLCHDTLVASNDHEYIWAFVGEIKEVEESVLISFPIKYLRQRFRQRYI